MTKVKQHMETLLFTATPAESVRAAAQRMTDHRVGALLVVEGGKVVGILSERDVLDRVVSAQLDPGSISVGEVCTGAPVAVPPDTSVLDCYRLIHQGGFRHLPVIRSDGSPLGVLSARDFFRCLAVEAADPEIGMEALCERLGQLSGLTEKLDRLP
jgi:CBS domain-containing protein